MVDHHAGAFGRDRDDVSWFGHFDSKSYGLDWYLSRSVDQFDLFPSYIDQLD